MVVSDISRRDPGLDIIRCIALASVVCVHFFLNTGFYWETVRGPLMQFLVAVRSGLMISVPLFLMLSGYLLCRKTVSPGYYLRIVRILFVYLCASLLYSLYRMYVLKDGLTPSEAIWGVLSFSTLSYGWYIEMYLGLFLLIPFLNVLYNGLAGKKQKQLLVLTFLVLTAGPSVLNIFRFDSALWWLQPSMNTEYRQLTVDWWVILYPITYYYLGCYLREFPIRQKTGTSLFQLFFILLIVGSFNFYRSYNADFVWGPWQDWRALSHVLLSVVIFTLFTNLSYERLGRGWRKVFAWISDQSLGAYLLSCMYDNIFYTQLNAAIPEFQGRVKYFFVAVAYVLTTSLLASALINELYRVTLAKPVKKWQEKASV